MSSIYRENVIIWDELKNIVVADVLLSLAFTLTLLGGLTNAFSSLNLFEYLLPISFIAVTLTFVLHELMHKFVAQHFGAIAAFKTSMTGLAITIISGMFGFLLGIPGATFIFTNKFTKREDGIVSLAGPLTNFAIFLVVLAIGLLLFSNFLSGVTTSLNPLSPNFLHASYLQNLLGITLFISLWLAFFNMLPIFPLDGSKVLAWNKAIYAIVILTIVALFLITGIFSLLELIFLIGFLLVIAYVFSIFSRGILLN